MNQNINAKKAALILGPLVILFLFFMMWRADPRNGQTSYTASTQTQTAMIFDVPPLIGKPIKDVLPILGVPEDGGVPTPEQAKLTREWDMSWKKGRHKLMATYEIATGRVVDFFIPTTDPSGSTTDITELRVVANTVEDTTAYSIVPVQALGKPGRFTGIKIVPR